MQVGVAITTDPMTGWQQTAKPTLVYNTGTMNVMRAACGTRHAALLSRAGELYTWGYGRGGSLGHGTLHSFASPRRVEGSWVKAHDRVLALAASDGCTAAITGDGSLYTWGSGLAGQLGHGLAGGCPFPKPVSTFADAAARVVGVSCGPHHTAAVTADGQLFTWGNGMFGRLGHGDTQSAYTPRKVQALSQYFVTSVSCGWWHTAAVACGRAQAPSLGSSFDPAQLMGAEASAASVAPAGSTGAGAGEAPMRASSASHPDAPSLTAQPSAATSASMDALVHEPLLRSAVPASTAPSASMASLPAADSSSDMAAVLAAGVGGMRGQKLPGGSSHEGPLTDTSECVGMDM